MFQKKTAVITGAAVGIGKATASMHEDRAVRIDELFAEA